MSAYDPQPRRGRTATAVLLAAALLAVVGAVFGYLAGVRHNDGKPSAGTSGGAATPAGKQCPDFIQSAARAKGAVLPLTLRLHVVTKQQGAAANGAYHSEVWICVAAGGTSRLWYQGHSIKVSLDERIVEGVNGLLLGGVNSIDDGKYAVSNPDSHGGTTTYTVSATELDISGGDGTSVETVVKSDS